MQSWHSSGAFEGRAMVTQSVSPVWINADRARVEQIFSNLLHNALKFTPAYGAVLVIVRQDARDAVLQVKDNGPGIARGALGRIFEPFWQGEQNPQTAHGGLGLGLALAKRLAEMHDGSISCESEGVENGAVFTVRFPVAAAAADRVEPNLLERTR
jgi:signal transduction histidine kinase